MKAIKKKRSLLRDPEYLTHRTETAEAVQGLCDMLDAGVPPAPDDVPKVLDICAGVMLELLACVNMLEKELRKKGC